MDLEIAEEGLSLAQLEFERKLKNIFEKPSPLKALKVFLNFRKFLDFQVSADLGLTLTVRFDLCELSSSTFQKNPSGDIDDMPKMTKVVL